ncbi:hypothetical protein D6219_05190 [Coxiella burnetii]|nr:hypothetical protein AYM00_04865 [Coxiella burnetii]ATN86421.1 hypothetical protein AYO29_08305 [Coxiella burnetii str. Schperling]AZV75258.1 hypothetical protein D6219_05190 [Coxiella burnetii]OYK80735.1 hypothetical protein CbuD7E6568_02560 [Coxiella burnetii]PNT86011.1 hypothetical protein C2L93_03395 [Coxiella burnetii]
MTLLLQVHQKNLGHVKIISLPTSHSHFNFRFRHSRLRGDDEGTGMTRGGMAGFKFLSLPLVANDR